MRIIIDGQALESEKVGGDNLEEILGVIQDEHVNDHAISQVQVNGEDYRETVPHASVDVLREDIELLELTTLSAEHLALHFISNGVPLIESIMSVIPRIVEDFRLGDEAEANEHYYVFLDALHLLMNMIQKTWMVLRIDFTEDLPGRVSMEKTLERFSEVMTELLRIQEENDWIYLADILDHELTRELQALKETLPLLHGARH